MPDPRDAHISRVTEQAGQTRTRSGQIEAVAAFYRQAGCVARTRVPD